MSRCFDWGRLVSSAPTLDDLRAFGDLNSLLLPYLRLTEWPPADSFPDVVHGWPDEHGLLKQYVVLMNRVRFAGSRCPSATKDWWTIVNYRVTPIVCLSAVRDVLGVVLYRTAPPDAGEEQQYVSSIGLPSRHPLIPTLTLQGLCRRRSGGSEIRRGMQSECTTIAA